MKNYFAHCVDVEELYENMVSPVCEKYELTYMEFTVLMFLTNNPQYDTATQIVKYHHLAKSHVSISIRSLQERGLILGEHKGGNHRTIHLSVADKARDIIADGRVVQGKFCEIVFAGFSKEEIEALHRFTEQVNRNIKEYLND
ncbi:MarR family winged helix-turn-helix transcriptional regulator [[Ruminococcus] lactaris]|uniref:MarR family winged helix-turn-helix transcriptional regulator n=1 Tax=[Ruminococcus] lactaris TaxID=46228 RepID=UPI0039921B44